MEVYVEDSIDGGLYFTRVFQSTLIASSKAPRSTPLSNALLKASSKEILRRYAKPLIIALMFSLWIIPAPLVNRADLKILGIPLLWFYYLALSIVISLTLTLLYLKSRGGESG